VSETGTRTVSVKIEGRVQGVFYRAWTKRTARSLGLDGWVRNARDGSVEAVFSGPTANVDAMLKFCEDGPPDARVTNIDIREERGSVQKGFKVVRDDRF
jgi:acylphosphatase